MKDLTFILPFGFDCVDRYENFLTSYAYLSQSVKADNIIVVECNEKPYLEHHVLPNTRYIFVKKKSTDKWSKSRLLNIGLVYCDTPAVMGYDVDCIIPKNRFIAVLPGVLHNKNVAIPADKDWHHIAYDIRAKFRKELDLQVLETCTPMMTTQNDGYGLMIYPTDLLRHIRGWNEMYENWGLEDIEAAYRIKIAMPRPLIRTGGPIYHLWHERNTPSTNCDATYDIRHIWSEKLLGKEPAQIREFYGITDTVCEYSKRIYKDELTRFSL
jgi:predicted glycosyltransferase involved in capsule biosynthesis